MASDSSVAEWDTTSPSGMLAVCGTADTRPSGEDGRERRAELDKRKMGTRGSCGGSGISSADSGSRGPACSVRTRRSTDGCCTQGLERVMGAEAGELGSWLASEVGPLAP